MFETHDMFVTLLGIIAVLYGFYRGDLWGIIGGAICILSGYPATRFFGFHKEAED